MLTNEVRAWMGLAAIVVLYVYWPPVLAWALPPEYPWQTQVFPRDAVMPCLVAMGTLWVAIAPIRRFMQDVFGR